MLTKLREFMALPRTERNERLLKVLHNRSQSYLSRCVFSVIGYWANRRNLRFVVQHRPDFHALFGGVPEFSTLYDSWTFRNRRNNSGDLTRFYTIFLNIKQVLADQIPGALVELGVYKGNSAALLANLGRQQHRHVYLFDTFAGFDSRDLQGVDRTRTVLFTDTSLEAVRNLVGTEGVTYIPGFFPESTSQIALPEQIAVAHLDCDLYEPMRAGLEYFYPRLSPGGIILIHDYASGHWPGAKQAVDEFFEHLPEKPIIAADHAGTAIIRKASLPH